MKQIKGVKIMLILGLFALLSSTFVIAADNNDIYDNNPEVQKLNEEIQAKKDKIDALKKAAAEYAQKIEEYKQVGDVLKNQMAMVDNQIVKVQLDIRTIQLQIDKTKLEIDALDLQLNKKEKEIENGKNNLLEYIKQLDKSDRTSYLEVLVLNNSFAEFFNELSYLEQIQNDIKQTVDRLKLLKDGVEIQKADKERQKLELEKYQIELETTQYKLADEMKAKEVLLYETKSSENAFRRMLTRSRAEQAEVDADIQDLQESVKSKIERLRKAGTSSDNTLVMWPIDPHEVTAYFHDPDYPFRYIYEHPAIDIRAKQGTPIRAPADGYVARVKDGGYGYSYIILIHDNQLSTVYGHVSAIYVKEDSYVSAGDTIGRTGGMPGTRGAGTMTLGPHLHMEVRLNGIPVNPLEYLP